MSCTLQHHGVFIQHCSVFKKQVDNLMTNSSVGVAAITLSQQALVA
jgi:hypothetical protein